MGVTPVEMQVMIPKTVEVARQQSSEMHKVNADQQNVAQKEVQRQEDNAKKVSDRNTSERIYVDDKEKEKNKKEKEKKKENSEESENEDESENKEKVSKDDLVGRHFDASI